MKQKRAKSYRKQVHILKQIFKFKEPIQILVDSDIILESDKLKFDIIKGFERTLQCPIKLLISQCCITHLYNSKNQDVINYSKEFFEKRRCNHKELKNSDDCIKDITIINKENKHRYLVATQNLKLRQYLRSFPGLPLIYMNKSVMIMEPLTNSSLKIIDLIEKNKLKHGLNDPNSGIEKDEEIEQIQPLKKRKIKGVNPLSMKKKKIEKTEPKKTEKIEKSSDDSTTNEQKKKRKRSHKNKNTTSETSESAEVNETTEVAETEPTETEPTETTV
ncbi:hypothetical protein B5S33_g4691 [[Candida] boidinii]|nr:hypothetical protein B5S33_g4691 [[Candida] boidinii]